MNIFGENWEGVLEMLNHCIITAIYGWQARAARRWVDLIEQKPAKNGAEIWFRDGKRTSKHVAEKIATHINVLQAVFDVPIWRLELGYGADYADFFAEITLRIDFSEPWGSDFPECYYCKYPDYQTYTIPCETREEAAEIVQFARVIFKDLLAWDGARVFERFSDENERDELGFFLNHDI